VRSRAAAAVLAREGFQEAYSMEGGIHAWKGLRASGPPDAGMAYFDPAKKAEELIALAWMLEEGSCKFCGKMGKEAKHPESIISRGGIVLKKALESVLGKELREIFEFSISVEVNAVDLYIKMERRVEGKDAKEVFQALSNQERNHLKRLTRAFQEG
jgi:hypothetical protein